MAVRFNITRAQYLDANGDPYAGGLLNFYETDTSTRLDTYSDNALTTANANPVVADSAGRFGDIFLQGQDYKVVFTDADANTIFTSDPIHGIITDRSVIAKTGAYTVTTSDNGKLITCDASGGAFTVTLLAAATAGGTFEVMIKNIGSSGVVTIDGDGSETIDGSTTVTLATQYETSFLRCDGTTWFALITKEVSADPTPELGGPLDTSDNAINESEGTAVASATTTNIWVTDGNTVHVTGTTTITSFGTAPRVGAWRKVIFDGALTLTDGANLNLPGAANITTVADDMCFVYAETVTLFKCLYFPVSGKEVKFTPDFTSSNQTISADALLEVAHGLGAVPSLVRVVMKCTTADLNYSIGDEVEATGDLDGAAADAGVTIYADATNVSLVQGTVRTIHDKTSFNRANITGSSWRWVVRAWL